MNIRTRRWLLAPWRQLRTRRLMHQHGPALPYDTAWALITLHAAPDEAAVVRIWARESPDGPPGIHYDHWYRLSRKEQQRRRTWLRRYGRSPIQLLDIEASLILSTGLHVLDWSPPPERIFGSASVPRPRSGDTPQP
ncbi:hypothetical protein [Streptomyces longwoodensis]|jgi:hypothetical protein|uniref:hypothetical protein n=1 Tax=Streptomyces longwoodensis TaxID=68231 RepID=UPI0033F99E5A